MNRPELRYRFLPWIVLVASLLFTVWTWSDASRQANRVQRKHFESVFRQVVTAIVEQVDLYTDSHHGGVGLFMASEEITNDEWRAFVMSLGLAERHPGIAGLGFVEIVPAEQSGDVEVEVDKSTPGYVAPPDGPRSTSYAVRFIEPIEEHADVMGFDMRSEPVGREALERARDTGEPALSDLMYFRDERIGFLLCAPIYAKGPTPLTVEERRRRIVGWIYAPFHAQEFIDGIFEDTLAEIRAEISLAIYSSHEIAQEEMLYGGREPAQIAEATELEAIERVALHGQEWTILAVPGPDQSLFEEYRDAPTLLAAGVLFSVALFALVYSLTRTRSHALALAERMTQDLRRQTGKLEQRTVELISAKEETERAVDTLIEQHETLARTDRMAAVGEMAGGLAHELRNPIAGMLMSLTNLRKDIEDPDLDVGEVRSRIDLLADELNRLTRLLNRYLSGVRHQPEPIEEVNLHDLVADLCKLLRFRAPENVDLAFDIPERLTWALPKDRMRQSLLNLVINAVDAMGQQGGEIRIGAVVQEDRLHLSVEDDGPGFSEDYLSAPAQRFETRKEGGTGLGLAMVRRVAQDLGGRLLLENHPRGGGRVTLDLPSAGS